MKLNRAYRADEFATLPYTHEEQKRDRADFAEACRRATKKGNRARELLHSPECDPRRSVFSPAKASDYGVKGG